MRSPLAILLLAALGACSTPAEPWSDAWMLEEGERYLADPVARRAGLLESMESRDNIYARERIANYGLESSGWDTLPVWNPRSETLTGDMLDAVEGGRSPSVDAAPLWDGETPVTMAAWVALGREVFFRYPLRADPYVAHSVRELARDESGAWPGVLAFRDVDGDTAIGISCALCHTSVEAGVVSIGAARREFDYGAVRLAYHDETGAPLSEEMRARLSSWGPGRADITADETTDPVAIPDLFGLREQSSLTQAGTIRHTGPIALAIRQETQYLHANHQRSRPPRELMFALSMFLYAIEPPPPQGMDEAAERGAVTFGRLCASCHSNAAFGGPLIEARAVGTDPALANGAARGTGVYRTAPLLGVRDAAPYLHDGTLPNLEALLGRARLREDYTGGTRGPGAIEGHEYGTFLSASEREALIAFLRTL